ncbi:TOBE domain-containing protein, partial [Mesorhizobium sp. M2C.T.Ca.TU.002.02.1.1]|uniref:TOBE domain-containing protein n=1 Tax=Mesorhizobium sp. M2C.T.Ca.TU.002.02.1.1 TaxID=2496788 RepID=UPI000FCC44EB
PAKALRKGDKAMFVVSDDRFHLTSGKPSGEFNGMQASVIGEEFVGATAVVHLEGIGGLQLKAQKSHEELESLNLTPGARVWVSWRAGSSHILPGE